MDFLNNISLGEAQKLSISEQKQLNDLGVESPQELLGLLHATPSAFSRMLGAEKARLLEKSLREVTGESKTPKSGLLKRRSPRFSTGAILTGRRPLRLKAPRYNVEQRDQLFEELQKLRALPSTKENLAKICHIESQLSSLLEAAA